MIRISYKLTSFEKAHILNLLNLARQFKSYGYDVFFAENTLSVSPSLLTYFFVTNGKTILYVQVNDSSEKCEICIPNIPNVEVGSYLIVGNYQTSTAFTLSKENIDKLMSANENEIKNWLRYVDTNQNKYVNLYQSWNDFCQSRTHSYTDYVNFNDLTFDIN